jgi:hypothetical protein
MRCDCLLCENNEDGYCLNSSYVCITEDGMCDSTLLMPKEEDSNG